MHLHFLIRLGSFISSWQAYKVKGWEYQIQNMICQNFCTSHFNFEIRCMKPCVRNDNFLEINRSSCLQYWMDGVTLQNAFALRTSSASLAMKNPTVLATIFTPRGFIMILVSLAEIKLFLVKRIIKFNNPFSCLHLMRLKIKFDYIPWIWFIVSWENVKIYESTLKRSMINFLQTLTDCPFLCASRVTNINLLIIWVDSGRVEERLVRKDSPTSDLVSIASINSLSLEKQRTEAWLKVIPTNDGDNTSVYISHPVPCNKCAWNFLLPLHLNLI